MLVQTAYGKSRVRLVQVARHGDRHDLRDLTVAIRFEGDYDESYTAGDNSGVLPTDTMKNTVYALAARGQSTGPRRSGSRWRGTSSIAMRGSSGCASTSPSTPGAASPNGAREHGQAFVRQGSETRTATVTPIATRTARRGGRRRPVDSQVVAVGVLPASCATSTPRCPRRAIGSWRRR